ncbi:c6 zinc finger domain containing protein [Niveomyces insectorum RCEF 264]|uniref:C6 zinc finger domain containing protein n=1 Tax=Niveomyces insectorum RCEF 264 TaxID=1081102 RepID=A0A162JFU5_9HYPO|nr:c6 zinc finger domain containing protein [Niveomyces insectorum RCEF 264]
MGASGRARLPNAPASGLFQVISLGDNDNNQPTREYKRRRPHKKSRGGCLGCKQRRVKCDQAMPTCLRCRRNQRDCVYENAETAAENRSRDDQAAHKSITSGGSSEASGSGGGAGNRSRGHSRRSNASTSTGRTVPHIQAAGAGVAGHSTPAGYGSLVPDVRSTDPALPVMATTPPVQPNLRFVRAQPFPVTGQEYGTPPAELLNHFETVGSAVFDMPNFLNPLFPMALHYPHFRGTILAVAAAHLYHKAPNAKCYRLAGHYQQSLALRTYRLALATPLAAQGQAGIDVLLATAMLMNMLAFVLPMDEAESLVTWNGPGSPAHAPPCANPDPDPRYSWVFSPHPNRLGWLAVAMGLTPLLVATAPWREKSRLRLLFANSDDERRTLSGSWQSLSRVPQAWLDVFGFDRRSTPRPWKSSVGSSSPVNAASPGSSPGDSTSSGSGGGADETVSENDRLYRAPLRVVAEIRHIPPNDRNLLVYFQFMGQLENDFRQKLFERDEKALWLFGMWMGLLCRYNHVWWTRRRTRCDFRAIRLWLHLVGVHQRPGDEGRLWRELLKDLDGTWGYNFDADPLMRQTT